MLLLRLVTLTNVFFLSYLAPENGVCNDVRFLNFFSFVSVFSSNFGMLPVSTCFESSISAILA